MNTPTKEKGKTTMEQKLFITAAEAAKILGISKSKSYQIVRSLNEQLRKQGYITVAGRVSAKYFAEKTYGGIENAGI